jgi:hypothetical protein
MRIPFRPTAGRVALAAALAGTAAIPLVSSPAHGDKAGLEPLAPVHRTLTVADAVERANCATTNLAGRRGATTTSWTTPRSVSVAAKLDGPAGNDWDLAIFDHSTGRQVGGSGAWGATEVAQTYAAAGRRLDIQACRLRG